MILVTRFSYSGKVCSGDFINGQPVKGSEMYYEKSLGSFFNAVPIVQLVMGPIMCCTMCCALPCLAYLGLKEGMEELES